MQGAGAEIVVNGEDKVKVDGFEEVVEEGKEATIKMQELKREVPKTVEKPKKPKRVKRRYRKLKK